MSEELRAREVLDQVRERDRYRHTDDLPKVPYDTAVHAMLSFASSAAGQREGWKAEPTERDRWEAECLVATHCADWRWPDLEEGVAEHSLAVSAAAMGIAVGRLLASPSAPEERRDEVEALKAEIVRQCGIGAGNFYEDSESGLWEIVADLDPSGLRAALTPVSQGVGNG